MISVTAHIDSRRLAAFGPYAEAQLRDAADHIVAFGQDRMSDLAPKDKHTLQSAIFSIVRDVSPAHTIGFVGIDTAIAPHAKYVISGTGIDGPFRKPVGVLATPQSRKSNRIKSDIGQGVGPAKVYAFRKQGEGVRFRTVVKYKPSLKIQRGKEFVGRAQDDTHHFTRIQTGVLSQRLALFFVADRTT